MLTSFSLASTRSNIIPQGSASTQGAFPFLSSSREPLFYPGTDDEEEESIPNPLQVQGATDGEVFGGVGANDEAPAPPAPAPSNVSASPPPYIRREPEISFVFDDITGDWEPYPSIFLPRPQRSAPTEQEVRRSSRSRSSPVGHDAAYLAAAQVSKPKKDKKSKDKGLATAASRKRMRHEANDDETTGRPAVKKPKVKDVVVVSDDERKSFLGYYS